MNGLELTPISERSSLCAGEKLRMTIAKDVWLEMENTGWTLRITPSGNVPLRVIPDGLGVIVCYGGEINL